jgi:hypothetical protein
VTNLAIAALLGWLLFGHAERVPMIGSQSAVTDTIVSAFMISFATCLIVTPVARRQMRSGRIAALTGGGLSALMPSGILWRAILLGAASVAIVSPMVMVASACICARGIALRNFLIFKLAFAAAEGAVTTPLIAALAISLTDVMQRKRDPFDYRRLLTTPTRPRYIVQFSFERRNLALWMMSVRERDLSRANRLGC